MTKIEISKKGLMIIGIITFLVLLFWYVKGAAKPAIYSCTQAHSLGYYGIPKSDPLYRPGLDRDKDGYACE